LSASFFLLLAFQARACIGCSVEGKTVSTELRFTTHDLELLPLDDGKRYEIIDGELYVSTAPHWRHQFACDSFIFAIRFSSAESGLGTPISGPGVVFAEDDAVQPDLVWIRRERFNRVVGEDGKLHAAPDLVVEVLSPGAANEERDLDLKRKLYSRRGVREYWIVDWRDVTVRVYRRVAAALQLSATLTAEDALESPLLPGFSRRVGELCAEPFSQ
jgi:Uma2 family endonuclease